MHDYDAMDLTAMAAAVDRRETTPDELLDRALSRMGEVNGRLTAVVIVTEDAARRRIDRGLPDGPFRGVPFLLKDQGCEAVDHPSHEGSRLMANTHWPVDSELYLRLAAAGVVVFGRTATPEGAVGVATEAAVYGAPTRNPWDLSRTPGGSSGGSGAAVAAGIVPAAHGADGLGSLRIPASCSGVFGFKPTRARLPDGPYSGEGWGGLSCEGFLTRSVRDMAGLLDAVQGPDLGAPYRAPPLETTFRDAIARPPRPLRIAVTTTSFSGGGVDPEVVAAVEEAARLLADLGHAADEAHPNLDHAAMMRAAVDIVACGTALSVETELARLGRGLEDGDLEGVVRGALRHARTLSGADYLAAVSRLHVYGRGMAGFFEDWDVLLTPTIAELPAKIGRFAHDTEDFLDFRLGPGRCFDYSPFTAAFNASGQPAMSIPVAWSDSGLPIGVHLAGRFGSDTTLMALAADLERARPWFDRRPPI